MRVSILHRFLYAVSLLSFLPNAQFNPLANPGCSTVESIVESCGPKIGDQNTVSSVVFSCICYDNSGNYVPSSWGNAATACTNYIESALTTNGNAFVAYAAGFCTDPSYAPVKTTPPLTSPTTSGVISSSPNQLGTTSTSSNVLPGGSVSNSNSSPTTFSSTSSTSTTTFGTTHLSLSGGSGSGAGAGAGAGASVSSTSSKAEGAVPATIRDGSLWSVFGYLFAAVFVL